MKDTLRRLARLERSLRRLETLEHRRIDVEMLFNAADGLLLLDGHGEISATEWWSQRQQVATLSGAFHQVQGRWAGTSAVRVEPASTNEIINPTFGANVTDGWTNNGMTTFARATGGSVFGVDSMHLVSDATADVVYSDTVANADGGEAWSGSCYIWLVAGDWQIIIEENNAGWANKASTAVDSSKTNQWQKVVVTTTLTAGVTDARIKFQPVSIAASEVYIDGVNFTAGAYATSHIDGGQGTGYAWTGAAHNSTSTRAATLVNLDAQVGLVGGNATVSIRTVVQMPYDADATWPATAAPVFSLRGATDANYVDCRFRYTGGDIFSVYLNGGYRLNSGALTFKAGDWLDIVVTLNFTADDYNLYINGVLIDNDTTALTAPTGLIDWKLGALWNDSNQTGYAVSGHVVFDRVLTATEIATLYIHQQDLVDSGAFVVPTQ